MANVTVLQWRGPDAFLEPEKVKELLVAWALRGTGKWDLHPFSEYLAERLEPVAQIVAAEFTKAYMPMEVVVFWFVMRHSGLPYLTLDFCVRESGKGESICYYISRRDVVLSWEASSRWNREAIAGWFDDLVQKFTRDDPMLRLAIRELGYAFSRRRTLPEEVQTTPTLLGRRRAG